MRRFAATIRDTIDLGELAIWYDANDLSTQTFNGSGELQEITNKGTITPLTMGRVSGNFLSFSNTYNGLNHLKSTVNTQFRTITEEKKLTKFLSDGSAYTYYYVFKVNRTATNVSVFLNNTTTTTEVGFISLFDNRTSINGSINELRHIQYRGVNKSPFTELIISNTTNISEILVAQFEEYPINPIKLIAVNDDLQDGDNYIFAPSTSLATNKLSLCLLFIGDFLETRVYKKSHSQEEIDIVTTQLKNKWGI